MTLYLQGVKSALKYLKDYLYPNKLSIESLISAKLIPNPNQLEKLPNGFFGFRTMELADQWLSDSNLLVAQCLGEFDDLMIARKALITPDEYSLTNGSVIINQEWKERMIIRVDENPQLLNALKSMKFVLLKDKKIDSMLVNVVAIGQFVIPLIISYLCNFLPACDFAGAFYPRVKRGGSKPSIHTFGTALDINVNTGNAWLQKISAKSTNLVIAKLFIVCGFNWGGLWKTSPDGMHFELVK